jgi:hypothetical protein
MSTKSATRILYGSRMADLQISRVAPGVTTMSSVDPFDKLAIYRIDRDAPST